MYLDASYVSNDCTGDDGSVALMVAGTNDTFNRVESRTRDMGVTPGFSRAETVTDLMRLGYQFLFQYHQPWTPNLNGENRLVPLNDTEVEIPETTIDLKELVTMSWQQSDGETASDILIISGTQNQTGTYSSAYGAVKDIETMVGLPGSQAAAAGAAPEMPAFRFVVGLLPPFFLITCGLFLAWAFGTVGDRGPFRRPGGFGDDRRVDSGR